MATIESATNANVKLEIDPQWGAARVGLRPFDMEAPPGHEIGHFALGLRSGALTGAGVAADSPVFSMRWTNAQKKCVVTFLEAFYVPTVVFTAAQELGLGLRYLTAYSADDAAGTAVAFTNRTGAVRKSLPQSLMGDMRIAAATLLTAGTRVRDSQNLRAGSGVVNVVNAAAGTAYVNPGGPFGFKFAPDLARGEHPIVLSINEGLAVENLVIFPAAGAAQLFVNIGWIEAPSY